MEDASGDFSRLNLENFTLFFIIGEDDMSNLVLAVLRSPQFTDFMAANQYILRISMANSDDALELFETFDYILPPMMNIVGARGIRVRTVGLSGMVRSTPLDEDTVYARLTAIIQDIIIRDLEENFSLGDSVRSNASSDDSDRSWYRPAHWSPFTFVIRSMWPLLEIVAPPLTRMYEAIVSFFRNLFGRPAAPMQVQEAPVLEQEVIQEQNQEEDALIQEPRAPAVRVRRRRTIHTLRLGGGDYI